jgi:diguanylate cyclase (GGDEF)-like protein
MNQNKTVVTVMTDVVKRPPAAQDACLVVIYGEDLGRRHPLDRESAVVVGRSSKATIQIDQESISRNHAEVSLRDNAFAVRDLGSTNGTYVNDEHVDGYRQLRDGDLLKVGHTIFKFLSGNNVEASYHEAIYQLTTTDGLTQVFNKRYFLETLEREISRAQRYGRALTLVLFDLDHFKQVNDVYGHLAGDHVLKQVAQVVHAHIRRDDVIARYGGEEFAIVLPEVDGAHAFQMAEKLRHLVESTAIEFDHARIPVTVSVGLASLPAEVTERPVPVAELIKRADENLYKAKRGGRNRVVA